MPTILVYFLLTLNIMVALNAILLPVFGLVWRIDVLQAFCLCCLWTQLTKTGRILSLYMDHDYDWETVEGIFFRTCALAVPALLVFLWG